MYNCYPNIDAIHVLNMQEFFWQFGKAFTEGNTIALGNLQPGQDPQDPHPDWSSEHDTHKSVFPTWRPYWVWNKRTKHHQNNTNRGKKVQENERTKNRPKWKEEKKRVVLLQVLDTQAEALALEAGFSIAERGTSTLIIDADSVYIYIYIYI